MNAALFIAHLKDTAFDDFTRNMKSRIADMEQSVWSHAAIGHNAEILPNDVREMTEQRIVELREFIKYDEFVKTRLPGLHGLHKLTLHSGVITFVRREGYAAMLRTDCDEKQSLHYAGQFGFLPVGPYALGYVTAPVVGLETGRVSTIEQLIFDQLFDVRLVDDCGTPGVIDFQLYSEIIQLKVALINPSYPIDPGVIRQSFDDGCSVDSVVLVHTMALPQTP